MLATAASGQAKHHPVYPGTRTVRGAIWDRLGGAWRLTEDALLKSERLRTIYSRNEPISHLDSEILPYHSFSGDFCGLMHLNKMVSRPQEPGRGI